MNLEDLMRELESYRDRSEGSVVVYKDDEELESIEIGTVNSADVLVKLVLRDYGPGAFTFKFFTNQEELKGTMRLKLEMAPDEQWTKPEGRSKLAKLLDTYRGNPNAKLFLYRLAPDAFKGFVVRWDLSLFKTEEDVLEAIEKEYGGKTWNIKIQSYDTLGNWIYRGSARLIIDAEPKHAKKLE